MRGKNIGVPNIYLIGSLRNPKIPSVAKELRLSGYDVFEDWFSPGPETDSYWQEYEQARGRTYAEALSGHHARSVFAFDEYHLNRAHGGVLVYPAGKSGHLELGYLIGQNKPGFILLDGVEPDRFDIMTQFSTQVCQSETELLQALRTYAWPPTAKLPETPLNDMLWLAGLLEGEGSFVCDSMNGHSRPRPRIALQMTDEDVMARASHILDCPLYGPYTKKAPRKSVWACSVTGIKAAEWMRILRPYLGERRKSKVTEILSTWNPYSYGRWRKKENSN